MPRQAPNDHVSTLNSPARTRRYRHCGHDTSRCRCARLAGEGGSLHLSSPSDFHRAIRRWQSGKPDIHQHKAIAAALEAIARGDRRILLTLATGTGKTSIAFQIAWKLFHAKWSLAGEPVRRPRILFLADRNILADQAYNAFSAFPPDAVARIDPRLPAQEAPAVRRRTPASSSPSTRPS